jgi:Ty3 transposon capsid-like protein
MATTEGQDQIPVEADLYRDDHDDGNDDTGNDDGTTGTAGASTGGAAGGAGTTSFNLRVKQNKIPEFFGTKSKDTISAVYFIGQLEDLAKANQWTDAQTYYHFANSLRNPAREWLSSVVDWDDDKHDQPVWSDFKDIFKQEYAIQTNERLILEGLANLAMKPNETMNELLTRITRTTQVIKDSFADYGAITLDPLNDINHGISNQAFRAFKKQYTAMMFNFFKMNLFKAALTPELRSVVAQQDLEAMTVKKMYTVATTAQREGKGKS